MDAIITKLKAIAEAHSSEAVKAAIEHLQASPPASWDVISKDFDALQTAGLWEQSEESSKLLQELRRSLMSAGDTGRKTYGRDISIVQVPHEQTGTLPAMPVSALPPELLDAFNQVLYLHVLATEPERILPPGKSLLSMVARPRQEAEHQNDQVPSLRAKVEDIVHRAFWDEALEALSNPTASSQVHRLQALYKDLYDALKYILPSNHPVLATLGSPLSPTSSPLLSAITHLREVVTALRERCAPARDQYIDELLHRLDDANPRLPVGELANIVVEVVKSILKFTEVMKDDLAQFVLGTMGEKQLRAAIREEARRGERQLVIEIWGEQRTQELWIQWVSAFNGTYLTTGVELGRHIWIPRLVEALGSVIAVSSPELPINDSASEGQNDNVLPPPLFVSGPSLLYVQNYLQALVIAAALRSLTRLPPAGPATENTSFMDRVWALLKAEIDGEPGSGGTKLINLADEVVRARKSLGEPLDAAEEEKLRAAVKRTLQIDDPVYVLLQKRLLTVITTRLVQSAQRKQQPMAPAHLQSGRERPGKRPRLVIDDEPEEPRERTPEGEVIVKGFEDPVLVRAIGEAVGRLRSKVEWTREVWHDLTDGESVAGTQTYQGT